MERRLGSMVFASVVGLGCGDGGSSRPEPEESSTTDEVATTIPPTTLTTTIGGDETSADTSGDASGDPMTTAGDDASTSGAASTSTAGDGTTGGTTGETALDLQWCNLQYPPTIPQPVDSPTYDAIVSPGEATTIFTRVYVEGLTDQSEFVDASDELIAEVGYGPDGSDPDGNDAWTWVAASGNPGWNGLRADGFGQENNDEYLAELSFAEPGTFDYAARYSIDGGATYVYCDLDGLVEDGYTPDQAGAAEIVLEEV